MYHMWVDRQGTEFVGNKFTHSLTNMQTQNFIYQCRSLKYTVDKTAFVKLLTFQWNMQLTYCTG